MVFEKNRKNENEKFEIQRRTGTKSELRNSKLAPNWWCTINLTPSPLTHSSTQIPFVLEIPLRVFKGSEGADGGLWGLH